VTAGSTPTVSFVCLFALLSVPTFLMGLTLPLLTTIVFRVTRDFVYTVSHLYFINTLGASIGAILTTYLLVSLVGLDGCIYVAATIDVVLGATVLLLARGARAASREAPSAAERSPEEPVLGRVAYALMFATGFIAIGYEIIWYRVISVLVKDSPYAFSSVLGVYLLGIALGSRHIHRYLVGRPGVSRRDLFFTIQFFTGLCVLLIFTGYFQLSGYAPLRDLGRLSFSTDLHPSLALFTRGLGPHSFADAYLLVDVFIWPMVFLFVPTLLIGASYPLMSLLVFSRCGGAGEAAGTTYFFGVIGNVLGGLVTGLVLLPLAGSERTILMLGSLGLLFGLAPRTLGARRLPLVNRVAAVLALALAAVWLFPRPGALYAAMHVAPFPARTTHVEEGMDAVVVTYENGDQLRNFINGQGHGYRPGPFFAAEAFEALSHAPAARRILVIGFGAGSITEAALVPADVRKVTVVELCGSVVANLRKLPAFTAVLADPRLDLVTGDGRRLLQRTEERFDVILMDPLRTTTAYSNNLHSRQFFALAARHLTPGGVLMVGGVDESPVVARTLMEEFAFVRAYPSFCLASRMPLRQDRQRLARWLDTYPEDTRALLAELADASIDGQPLAEWTAPYPANRDWRPVTEYYLGLQVRQWLASGLAGRPAPETRR
jgi:predicted membrane-bound spermidine synthase